MAIMPNQDENRILHARRPGNDRCPARPGQLAGLAHVLVVLRLPMPCRRSAPTAPAWRQAWREAGGRRGLARSGSLPPPSAAGCGPGSCSTWQTRFAQLTALRKAFALLLEEQPAAIDVLIDGDSAFVALAPNSPPTSACQRRSPADAQEKDAPRPRPG